MEKMVQLTDGRKVLIREMKIDDVDQSYAFFSALPEEDRAYLRVDVTDKEIVEKRIKRIEADNIRRLIAIMDDQIVADGALELEGTDWKKHVAELRLIVARSFQHLGLGKHLARELYLMAAGLKVEQIIVKFMGPQKRPQSIFKKLGFHKDAVFKDYVKDIHGQKQDLVIMRCDLNKLWQKLGDFISESDWIRTR